MLKINKNTLCLLILVSHTFTIHFCSALVSKKMMYVFAAMSRPLNVKKKKQLTRQYDIYHLCVCSLSQILGWGIMQVSGRDAGAEWGRCGHTAVWLSGVIHPFFFTTGTSLLCSQHITVITSCWKVTVCTYSLILRVVWVKHINYVSGWSDTVNYPIFALWGISWSWYS